MLFSLRSFVQTVPVSCWLTIMNQCALDLGSFQLLLLYCCHTRVEIHRSSCVCVDMSARVLMESMHRSTFDFPVLIIYSFPFYVDKTLKQTWSFASEISRFIGAFVFPQTPQMEQKRNPKERWGNIHVLLCIMPLVLEMYYNWENSEFSHCEIDTS